MNKFFLFLIYFLFFSNYSFSHSGEISGFYDGLTHPVLGFDHFIAMLSVGIVSTQKGGKYIWFYPMIFVIGIIFGIIISFIFQIPMFVRNFDNILFEILQNNPEIIYYIIEFGIAFSVFFLGLLIFFKEKFKERLFIITFIVFGVSHGAAHGIAIPYVLSPYLFVIGFLTGSIVIHIIGIGFTVFNNLLLKILNLLTYIGYLFSIYGLLLIIKNIMMFI